MAGSTLAVCLEEPPAFRRFYTRTRQHRELTKNHSKPQNCSFPSNPAAAPLDSSLPTRVQTTGVAARKGTVCTLPLCSRLVKPRPFGRPPTIVSVTVVVIIVVVVTASPFATGVRPAGLEPPSPTAPPVSSRVSLGIVGLGDPRLVLVLRCSAGAGGSSSVPSLGGVSPTAGSLPPPSCGKPSTAVKVVLGWVSSSLPSSPSSSFPGCFGGRGEEAGRSVRAGFVLSGAER